MVKEYIILILCCKDKLLLRVMLLMNLFSCTNKELVVKKSTKETPCFVAINRTYITNSCQICAENESFIELEVFLFGVLKREALTEISTSSYQFISDLVIFDQTNLFSYISVRPIRSGITSWKIKLPLINFQISALYKMKSGTKLGVQQKEEFLDKLQLLFEQSNILFMSSNTDTLFVIDKFIFSNNFYEYPDSQ